MMRVSWLLFLFCIPMIAPAYGMEKLSSVKQKILGKKQKARDVQLCPICFEDAVSQCKINPIITLSCKHLLHFDCLNEWINSNNNNHLRCPTCRELFSLKNVCSILQARIKKAQELSSTSLIEKECLLYQLLGREQGAMILTPSQQQTMRQEWLQEAIEAVREAEERELENIVRQDIPVINLRAIADRVQRENNRSKFWHIAEWWWPIIKEHYLEIVLTIAFFVFFEFVEHHTSSTAK